jgi:hypothetical protein
MNRIPVEKIVNKFNQAIADLDGAYKLSRCGEIDRALDSLHSSGVRLYEAIEWSLLNVREHMIHDLECKVQPKHMPRQPRHWYRQELWKRNVQDEDDYVKITD